MTISFFRPALGLAAAIFLSFIASAFALEPNSVFSNGMVLQRGMTVPVWGTATAGSEVTIQFADQSVSGKADASGNWRLSLSPLDTSASERVMTISSGGKEKQITGVLVGDVWVGSGQSNMAGRVGSYMARDETLAKLVESAPYSHIRLMNGGPKPRWQEATSETVTAFSAILFAFGERLHRDLDVPIGLIVGAVGGTPSGSWIPTETYQSSEKCKSEVAEFAKTWNRERAHQLYQKKLEVWEGLAAKAEAAGEKPKGRKPIPPGEPGESSRGGKIGGLFDRFIRPVSGYAIRGVLWDQGESGTGIVGLGQYTTMSELIHGWRELWGQGDFPFLFVQKPSGLGNAFSNENPITREADAFVPLPEISKIGQDGSDRYLYTRLMLGNDSAWMVPAIDLGPMVHPLNKWGYGNRAAEVAEQRVYQKKGVQAYGPLYESHTTAGSEVTIRFTEVAGGLVSKHADRIQGFALAGKDGKWHWASAGIRGKDSVIVSCPEVSDPIQVRFAYAKDRRWANLFNQSGLPALAFTTEAVK